jgi:2-keto-3-deoxy-6-phosphogluconate aldolase
MEEDAIRLAQEVEEKPKTLYHVGAGRLVNENKFESMLKMGCGICTSPVFKHQEKELQWAGDVPICPECAQNYAQNEEYKGLIH